MLSSQWWNKESPNQPKTKPTMRPTTKPTSPTTTETLTTWFPIRSTPAHDYFSRPLDHNNHEENEPEKSQELTNLYHLDIFSKYSALGAESPRTSDWSMESDRNGHPAKVLGIINQTHLIFEEYITAVAPQEVEFITHRYQSINIFVWSGERCGFTAEATDHYEMGARQTRDATKYQH